MIATTRWQLYIGCHPSTKESYVGDIISQYVPGFTLVRGWGYWKGKAEECFVCTIIVEADIAADIALLCKDLCLAVDQDCILVTADTCQTTLID